MAEPSNQSSESNTPKVSAAKDKNCPYCGQAFTSSSLGRHLDLYIKERNPKPPDGIHDVDAIRKLRGGITRRQPRGSLGGRVGSHKGDITPTGTPRPAAKSNTPAHESEGYQSGIPRDGSYVVDSTLSRYPFAARWEATGVMNDIPGKGAWENEQSQEPMKRPSMQRNVSRQVAQKAQFDVKQKLADAMDTARAAELALREILSSLRSAKIHIDNNSMPFDFDPLSLDFPALTLQCLRPPPTLFSSTQNPTSTSWSVQCPGIREYGALEAYFRQEFEAWRVTCASATTSALEEMTYPFVQSPLRDTREAVKKAERSAETLEKQVAEHLQSAFAVWEALPSQRQNELWVLELARGVGRKHKETEKLKQEHHRLKQDNANLKSQIEHLNRLQQPREFKMLSPRTIPIDKDIISYTYQEGVRGAKSIGFDLEDRHLDLGSVVTRSIERWKSVITSTRVTSTGMSAQKPLVQPSQPSQEFENDQVNSPLQTQPPPQTPQKSQPDKSLKRQSTGSTTGPGSDHTANSANNTAPPSIEETSDQDADAEMEDDDSFAIMATTSSKTASQQMQSQNTLEVPRQRGTGQQQQTPNSTDVRYMMQGTATGRATAPIGRSIPNMNMPMPGNTMEGDDLTMTMQGVQGDNMYME